MMNGLSRVVMDDAPISYSLYILHDIRVPVDDHVRQYLVLRIIRIWWQSGTDTLYPYIPPNAAITTEVKLIRFCTKILPLPFHFPPPHFIYFPSSHTFYKKTDF